MASAAQLEHIDTLKAAQETRRKRRELLAGRLKSREREPQYKSNCAEIREKIANLDTIIADQDKVLADAAKPPARIKSRAAK